MDIKQILSEATNGALNEEVLSEIENVFEQKVNDRVEIHVENALNEQDELYTEKLKELVEKIDLDHTSKLTTVVEALDNDRAEKLKVVIEKYEKALNEEAKNFQEDLVENISNYIDVYLEEKIPSETVAEAVKKEDGSTVLHKYMDGEQRLGGIGDYIAQEIMKRTDVECRVTSLGHVQRGAPPTASDRILASAFGVYAVDLLNQKKFDRMVAWRDRKVVDVPIDEGIRTYKNVERKDSLVETALSLGIYIGDDI